jgi:hypothetical protein
MYRVPVDLDLSAIIGQSTTQVRVGEFDVQLAFGPVNFAIQSPIKLIRNGKVIGTWEEGRWPDSGFYETMNVKASKWEIPDDRTIVISLENGIEMHLMDDSERYECMQIERSRASSSVSQGGGSMIWIKQRRWMSAQPHVAQPHR